MKKTLTTLVLVLALAFSVQVHKATATIHTVDVRNNTFAPNQFTCDVGDTVRFVWQQGNHTATSQSVPVGAASFNATMSSTNTTFDYEVTVEGNYAYICSFHGGMSGSFTANAVSGRNETLSASSVRMFPNPASEAVILETNLDAPGVAFAQLMNTQGQVVAEEAFGYLAAGNQRLYVGLSKYALPRGLYFVRFTVGNATRTERLVVR